MQAQDDLVATAAYQPEPAAAAAARRFVRDTLRTWQLVGRSAGQDELVDDAVLLTSELVTNAVVHAGTPVQVTCRLAAGAVEVVVLDRHPVQLIPEPQHGEITEEERTSGRGLMLPSELASSWGVTYARTAKAVWFRLGIGAPDAGSSPAGQHPAAGLATAGERPAVGPATAGQHRSVTGRHRAAAGQRRAAAGQHGAAGGQHNAAAGQHGAAASPYGTAASRGQQGSTTAGRPGPARRAHAAGMLTAAGTVGEGAPAGDPGNPARDLPLSARGPAAVLPVWARRNLGRLGYEELLSHTVEAARAVMTADAAYLLAADDDGELKVRAAAGAGPASGAGLAQLAAGSVMAAAGPVRALAEAAMSLVTVPLLAEGRVTGVLAVAAAEPGRFGECDAARLQDLADRSAGTLERARLGELERARLARVSYLAEAGELLSGYLDQDKIVALAAQLVVPQLADWCAVLLADAAGAARPVYLCHADESRADALAWLIENSLAAVPDGTAADRGRGRSPGKGAGLRWQLATGGLAARQPAAGAPDRPGGKAAVRPGGAPDRPGKAAVRPGGAPDRPGGSAAARLGGSVPSRTDGSAAARLGGSTPAGAAQLAADGAWCFPLADAGGDLGMLAIGGVAGRRLPADVTELAEGMARRTALALSNARQQASQQLASRAPQPVPLPPGLPQIPGAELAAAYDGPIGAGRPGSDFYDVFAADAGRWRFVIGDVCGTEPAAAAIGGLARHTLRILAREGHGIAAVLERLNDLILDEGEQARFLTLVHGEITAAARPGAPVRVSLACAGHPQPLLLRNAGGPPVPAAEPQPLLGVIDGLTFSTQTVELAAGDLLLMVTDGVTQRRHGYRLLDDGDGLAALLAQCRGLGAGAVTARIQQAVREFSAAPLADDLALLALAGS